MAAYLGIIDEVDFEDSISRGSWGSHNYDCAQANLADTDSLKDKIKGHIQDYLKYPLALLRGGKDVATVENIDLIPTPKRYTRDTIYLKFKTDLNWHTIAHSSTEDMLVSTVSLGKYDPMLVEPYLSHFNVPSITIDDYFVEDKSPFNAFQFIIEKNILDSTIQRIINNLQVSFKQGIFDRIRELAAYGYEDEPDELPISTLAVENLIALFQQYPGLVRPTIVLTPSKNIQIQWGTSAAKKLVLELLPNHKCKFYVAFQDPNKIGEIYRMSSPNFLTKDAIKIVKEEPFNAFDWIMTKHG